MVSRAARPKRSRGPSASRSPTSSALRNEERALHGHDRALHERDARDFRTAVAGLKGEDALHAIGEAYGERLSTDPTYLRSQMQAYAASDDPQIRDVVRAGYGELVEYVERVSGLPSDRVSHFFAKGMLLNVMASLDLLGADEGWAQRLVEGCREDV